MKKTYRPDATGALLDIYETAIEEMKSFIWHIDDAGLTVIIDAETTDENCRTVQSILSHVVHAGFGYANSIHRLKGHVEVRQPKTFHNDIQSYLKDLDGVFNYTQQVFSLFKDDELEAHDDAGRMKAAWGQVYDVEQLAEHAIVHILRHKRQLERLSAAGHRFAKK